MSLKVPSHYSNLRKTALNYLISCLPFTLPNYRNSKVTGSYMPVFSKQETKRLQVTPALNCNPWTFLISNSHLQTFRETRDGKNLIAF